MDSLFCHELWMVAALMVRVGLWGGFVGDGECSGWGRFNVFISCQYEHNHILFTGYGCAGLDARPFCASFPCKDDE